MEKCFSCEDRCRCCRLNAKDMSLQCYHAQLNADDGRCFRKDSDIKFCFKTGEKLSQRGDCHGS